MLDVLARVIPRASAAIMPHRGGSQVTVIINGVQYVVQRENAEEAWGFLTTLRTWEVLLEHNAIYAKIDGVWVKL
jgi:hypothetical protein